MKLEPQPAWNPTQSGFHTADGTRLFYRSWAPADPRVGARRALVFLHRGHEHSGRIQPLVEQFAYQQDWAFAWDARGHGHSPGARGDAPSFEVMVRDLDDFIGHLQLVHGIAPENIVLVANSVGAVLAATWLHDYAPKVRALIMAAAAFSIKLYVPLAKPALRLASGFKRDLFVTSYIRSSMLTHSGEQAAAYDADPLIAKAISARILLGLADTAQRIVQDAAAIDTPILMLAADKDYVVSLAPQRQFFERLSSPLKRFVLLRNTYHAVLYEMETKVALQACRQFIDDCYALPTPDELRYVAADRDGHSARQYQRLLRDQSAGPLAKLAYGLQRTMLGLLGPLSDGMRIGLEHGFDSGASLDYVYRNQAGGRLLVGKMIDRGYLDAVGWRGIRLRKQQLQQLLGERISAHPAGRPLRILDVAAGSGRYVLETLKRFQGHDIEVTLRDFAPYNLEQARALAGQLQLDARIDYQLRDAFSEASYPAHEAPYDIVIVSGLYELFSENALILRSLRGVARQLLPGGHLIYTGQPWHPQVEMIAQTLVSHTGKPWQMRPRPQNEIDGLVEYVGLRKVSSLIGLDGIFTVSLARKPAGRGAGD